MNATWQELELFRPVQHRLLVPQVVDAIRAHIQLGQLRDYERLPPVEKLASLLGVSVGTAHNALRVLAYLGMVEARPGRGTFVVPHQPAMRAQAVALGRANVSELVELRRMIEVEAARKAARNTDGATAIKVFDAEWQLRFARSGGGPRAVHKADVAFHRAVVAHSGEPLLSALHGLVIARLEPMLLVAARRWARGPAKEAMVELHDRLASIVHDVGRDGDERRPTPASAARVARQIADLEQPRGP